MGTPIPLFYDKHMIAIQSQSDFPFLDGCSRNKKIWAADPIIGQASENPGRRPKKWALESQGFAEFSLQG